MVIDAVKTKLNLAGIDANSGRYRLAVVQYDEDHGYYAHLFFTMLRIRDNDMAIRELAHFAFDGHTLTIRENGRVIARMATSSSIAPTPNLIASASARGA